MQTSPCRQVKRDEIVRAVHVQLAAFIADPIMRWMWPEAGLLHRGKSTFRMSISPVYVRRHQ